MKNTVKILGAGLLACGLAASAFADAFGLVQKPPQNVFEVGSSNLVSAGSWGIISARSGNAGTPVVTFVAYGGDSATAKLFIFKINAVAVTTFTNSTTTLFVNNTNGFDQSSVLIIRHKLTDNYEKRVQTSNTGVTNLVTTVAPMEAVVPGDLIYQATSSGLAQQLITVGAATNYIAAPGGIFVGQQGLPLLIEVDGSSAASMFSASGFYAPPVTVPRPGL